MNDEKIDEVFNDSGLSLDKRISNIILHIEDGFENIRRHYISYERVSTPTVQPQYPRFSDPSTMDDEDMENFTPLQNCIVFTLEEIYKCGYRRYKGPVVKKLQHQMVTKLGRGIPSILSRSLYIPLREEITCFRTGKTLQVKDLLLVK